MKDSVSLIERLPSNIVEALKKAEQSKKWHKEGCVYNHILEVVDRAMLTGDNDLVVAAIFHDLGKLDTETRTIVNGEEAIHHFGHEFISLRYLREHYSLYEDLIIDYNKVEEIVLNHMRAHLYENGTLSKPKKRETFENLKYFNDIIAFSKCDDGGKQ